VIALLQLVLIERTFGARHPPDLQQPQLHTPAPVAQLGSNRAHDVCDLPHETGQHANAVPQQGAVSWVVDIGLHHGRVHAHPPSSGHALLSGDPHQAFMNLLENLRPERHAPPTHGLGIRGLGAAHMSEVPVHQIGAHLALQHLVAPIPDVLENQQPQHHVGRRAPTPAAAALRMPFRQCLVHGRNDRFIRQDRIGVLHPVFAKIAHFVRDQPVAKAELGPPHLNHGRFSRVFEPARSGRSSS
jgi:hypothetical protein